jgi:glutamate carboxypeptidase
MNKYRPILDWVDTQRQPMVDLVSRLCKINSHSFNMEGLKALALVIQDEALVFNEKVEFLDLPDMEIINLNGLSESKPLGPALKIQKRPSAPRQVLLVIHTDTVYPPENGGPEPVFAQDGTLKGPGVTDAKGGIAVMFKALEALERSPFKDQVGWTVLLNPDEEIGSPGSRDLLQELAKKAHIGLVFEPCLPNGDLVGERKGSGNFTLVIRGRAAHAGRDIHLGRNAIEVMAECILKVRSLKNLRPGLSVNIGIVEGGKALNVVPDIAIARFNIRIEKPEDEAYVWVGLKDIMKEFNDKDGISLQLHGGFFSPPKMMEGTTRTLFREVKRCALEVGLNIDWQPSGGVCDGNRLAAVGLPNVDTMGVKGGNLHSSHEYLNIDSLTERAKLAALVLMQFGAGELNLS